MNRRRLLQALVASPIAALIPTVVLIESTPKELKDVIYNINPVNTPLMSHVTTKRGTYHEWVTDELTEDSYGLSRRGSLFK